LFEAVAAFIATYLKDIAASSWAFRAAWRNFRQRMKLTKRSFLFTRKRLPFPLWYR